MTLENIFLLQKDSSLKIIKDSTEIPPDYVLIVNPPIFFPYYKESENTLRSSIEKLPNKQLYDFGEKYMFYVPQNRLREFNLPKNSK